MKTFTTILTVLLVSFPFACQSELHVNGRLKGSHIATVLRANSDRGSGMPPYGDVFIYDLDSSQLFRITNDLYYESEVKMSPDLAHLAILACREGSERNRAIKGVGGPFEMYIIDLPSALGEDISRSVKMRLATSMRGQFTSLQWRQDSRAILFAKNSNVVYQLDSHSDSVQRLFTLPNVDRILELELSPNDSLLAVRYSFDEDGKSFGEGIGVLNFISLEWRVIRTSMTNMGAWSPSGAKLAYRDTVFYIYDYKTNRTTHIPIPDSIVQHLSGKPRFYDDNTLICYWGPIPLSGGGDRLILYDLRDNTERWILDTRLSELDITQIVQRR